MLGITYAFTCDYCGKAEERTAKVLWPLPVGMEMPLPGLPYGWHTVNGRHVCGDHEVVVKAKALEGADNA